MAFLLTLEFLLILLIIDSVFSSLGYKALPTGAFIVNLQEQSMYQYYGLNTCNITNLRNMEEIEPKGLPRYRTNWMSRARYAEYAAASLPIINQLRSLALKKNEINEID